MSMVEKNDEHNSNGIQWDPLKIQHIFQDKKDFLTTFHNELTLLPSDFSSEDPQRIIDAFNFLQLLEENYFSLGVLLYLLRSDNNLSNETGITDKDLSLIRNKYQDYRAKIQSAIKKNVWLTLNKTNPLFQPFKSYLVDLWHESGYCKEPVTRRTKTIMYYLHQHYRTLDTQLKRLLGKDFMLSQTSPDRTERKQSLHLAYKFFDHHAPEYATIFNIVLATKVHDTELFQYKEPIEQYFLDNDFTKSSYYQIKDTLLENISLAHEYFKLKAKILGLQTMYAVCL